jgi:transposase-like protein
MESEEFLVWLSEIGKLSAVQRVQALAAVSESRGGDDEARGGGEANSASARQTTPESRSEPVALSGRGRERLDALGEVGHFKVGSQGCPHCAGRNVVSWGRSDALARYRCKDCRRTFNALTKTPMARLRKKDQWLAYAKAMLEGASVTKAAQACHVHCTTAFRWRHRFLSAPASDKPKRFSGLVEADETFILESFEGRRSDLRRPPRKRGGKAKHPGAFFENIAVLVARDRQGATLDAVLPQLDAASVKAAMEGVVTQANRLICDGGLPLRAFARRANIRCHVVPAPGKPLPEAPNLHINNVNAYHGRLKEWMRRFHGVATKNLPNYLGWRRAMEAWGLHANPENRIFSAIGMGPYQQETR